MVRVRIFGLTPLVLASFSTGISPRQDADFRTKCMTFNPSSIVPNSTVNSLEYVTSGTTLQFQDADASCGRSSQSVSANICRIALNITTSNRSGIISEYWLPETWNSRFLATGNGGIDGCLKYEDVDYGIMNGFAAAGSNNGHNGTTGLPFYHNNDVLEDYVWRSLHTMTEAGKNLTAAFYTSAANKSYYLGCSGGGRQGIKAAEMFPGDYDGIVVGAPGQNFNNMTSWRASFFEKTGAKNSTNFISANIWQGLIHDEILKQCDSIDGVADGIIEDPELCNFDPTPLLCSGNATDCLTSAQVAIVQSIFSPLLGADSELVYPAMQPGSEELAASGLYAGVPFPYSLDWFRYVVYDDTSFDDTDFGVADISAAQELNPFNVQTFPSDLGAFRTVAGKMLIYHGQQDQQISSFSSPRFYNHLADGMGLSSSLMDQFVRFFRISGMFHCATGPGAWMIGALAAGSTGFEAESNVLAAMVKWVEEGVAPDTIEGTKFVDDDVTKEVVRQRKHCRYPFVNAYVGGNDTLSTSWECKLSAAQNGTMNNQTSTTGASNGHKGVVGARGTWLFCAAALLVAASASSF